ncbi:MAG TPA: geopeptide radical SAM maturase, partial [Geobacteraceae bacterium]
MHLSRYLKIYPQAKRPGLNLLYSTRTGATLLIDEDTLRAAQDGTLADPERDTLARLGLLVPDPAEEREEMRNIFLNANQRRNLFQGIVVLNLDCNLACPYCYEGNFRGGQYMSPATAKKVVETIRRGQIGKGRDVVLTFYGGEPLLSIPLMKEIAASLKEAAALRGTGFAFNLVTNGTLLSRPVAEELVPLGLNGAKFTLDGPRETHDKTRPFVSGKGSYDVIIARIREVCDLVPIQIGGNYTRHNYRSFPLLLNHLINERITPEKVTKVLFTPVIARASSSPVKDFDSGCACDYEPWVIEAGLFLREEVLARGFSTPRLKLFSCMAELENDLVINF